MNSPFFQLKSLSTDTINILLIEDRDEDAELTMLALKELTFINQIQWIQDSKEAINFLFKKGKYTSQGVTLPDLILLDLDIPELLSGIDVLKELCKMTETKSIPVVIVSTPIDESRISEVYKAGANSYIPKPLTKERFMEVLNILGFRIS